MFFTHQGRFLALSATIIIEKYVKRRFKTNLAGNDFCNVNISAPKPHLWLVHAFTPFSSALQNEPRA